MGCESGPSCLGVGQVYLFTGAQLMESTSLSPVDAVLHFEGFGASNGQNGVQTGSGIAFADLDDGVDDIVLLHQMSKPVLRKEMYTSSSIQICLLVVVLNYSILTIVSMDTPVSILGLPLQGCMMSMVILLMIFSLGPQAIVQQMLSLMFYVQLILASIQK